jgi:hypothetical protein
MRGGDAQSRKGHLFNCYASNLSACLGQYQNTFLCPLCLRLFPRDSLSAGDITEEHIIPRSLGGRLTTLTCRECNSRAGSTLEAQLAHRLEREDFLAGLSDKPLRARVSIGDGEMGAQVYRYPDRIEIHGVLDISHPELHATAVRALDSGRMPGEVSLRVHYRGLPSWVAALRIGYLIMFSYFGYGYILHQNLQQVRRQISRPDQQSIGSRAVVRLEQAPPVPNGVGLLYAPKDLRCFFVALDLSTALDRYLGVVLPGLDAESEQIYDKWHALVGPIREVHFSMAMIAFDPQLVCDPSKAGVSTWIWNNLGKRVPTWAGKSQFDYHGSVATGTEIWYGRKPYHATVTPTQYESLLCHFQHRTVRLGASGEPPPGSVGAWLQEHVTRSAIASYVGAILIHEGYAERVPGESSNIHFIKDSR